MTFGELAFFVVAEDDDAAFCPVRFHFRVLFDGDAAHCGNSAWGTLFAKLFVAVLGDDLVDAVVEETLFLLFVAVDPNGAVRIVCQEGLYERPWTVAFEFAGADEGCFGKLEDGLGFEK